MFKYSNFYIFFSYLILLFIGHLVFASLTLFFHFLLEHDFSIIENWLQENSWIQILLTKIFAILTLNLLFIGDNFRAFLKDQFTKIKIHKSILVLSFSSFFLLILLLQPNSNPKKIIIISKWLISYLGNLSLFLPDIFIGLLLFSKAKSNFIFKALTGAFLFAINLIFFNSFIQIGSLYLLAYSICFYMIQREQYSFKNACLYLCIFICPSIIIFGQDAVWGLETSPYLISRSLSIDDLLILFFLSLYYLEYSAGKIIFWRKLNER